MTTLGDFVSAVLAEFTMARVHADLEAARVAETYRLSPLLEGAPIPRFRIPELTIEIPVAIANVTEQKDAASRTYPAPIAKDLSAMVDRASAAARITLPQERLKRLIEAVARDVHEKWSKALPFRDALLAAGSIAEGAAGVVRTLAPEPTKEEGVAPEDPEAIQRERDREVVDFRRSLQGQLHQAIAQSLGSGPRVEVLTRTSDLREVRDSGTVSRMSLTIREDGFELVKIDRADGTQVERLVPE